MFAKYHFYGILFFMSSRGRLEISRHFAVVREGKAWGLDISDTVGGRGITSTLDRDVHLEWKDVLQKTDTTSLHMFLGDIGRTRDIPYGEKLRRMTKFATSIAIYNSIMNGVPMSRLSVSQVTEMVNGGHLPRPEIAIIDTQTIGLRVLFRRLGFKTEKTVDHAPYIAPWTRLVELAVSGELVESWQEQKANPYDTDLVHEVMMEIHGDNQLED